MSTDSARSSRAESDWSWNSFMSAKVVLYLSGQGRGNGSGSLFESGKRRLPDRATTW